MDARGVVGAAAVAEGDLAALEMAEEIGPFLICRGPVFPGGAQCPAAGDEGPVAVDDLLGVDRLISHGGIHVAVAGYQLSDMRRHPVHETGNERFTNHAEFLSSTNGQLRHLSSSLRFFVAAAASCDRQMQQIWVHHRLS